MFMASLDRITFDPQVMGGKPCIRGLRVTVGMIVGLYAAGRTPADLRIIYRQNTCFWRRIAAQKTPNRFSRTMKITMGQIQRRKNPHSRRQVVLHSPSA